MREDESRSLPWTDEEVRWAQRRPTRDRTPVPDVGDEVMYRHNAWEPPSRAEVLAVQSLDDIGDPNLWRPQSDEHGELVRLEGRYVMTGAMDPWPELTLRTKYGIGVTREARLRGSPGWLPLDWERRYRPVPEFVIIPR
jgi:hypothetical protein